MITTGLVKSMQDIMRQDDGVDGDAQRLSQLVWMIFLKILDDSEQELEIVVDGYVPALPAELQWRAWASNEEGLTGDALSVFVNMVLFPGLRDLTPGSNPRTVIVRDAFEDTYNYMKSGTLLRQVVNKVNTIDFNTTADRHQFNDLYEKLLRDLQSAGNAGEYYTPRALTRLIVDLVDPKLGESVLDPACGTGGFLANAVDHLRAQTQTADDNLSVQLSINGVEKKQLPHMLALTNMMLHGIDSPSQIRRSNTLGRPLTSYGPGDRVDVIVTNPPFGGFEEPGIEQNFPANVRTRETADLFLVLIMRLLKDGGRCGVILPDGSLFGEGVKTRIKQQLVDTCDLHTIVRIPGTAFAPYTSLATNLLFFEKGKPTSDIWYWEHQLPTGVKHYNKTRPIAYSEFDDLRDWWTTREPRDNAWKVPIEDVRTANYNLNFKNPHKADETPQSVEHLLDLWTASEDRVQSIVSEVQSLLLKAWEAADVRQ